MSNRPSFAEQPGAGSSALAVRQACRSGALNAHTSGLASAHVQGNLVILPRGNAHAVLLSEITHRNRE